MTHVADEALLARDDDRLEPGMGAERLQDVPDVVAYRLRCHVELGGDLFRRSPLSQEVQNLLLAGRQVHLDRGKWLLVEQRNGEDGTVWIVAGNRD